MGTLVGPTLDYPLGVHQNHLLLGTYEAIF